MADIAGLKLIVPSSIANSGGSASIGTNGKVTFSGVTSLSLNGVFSSTYDDYIVVLRTTSSQGASGYFRLRSSGTDATGSNYVYQYLYVSSTTVEGWRSGASNYVYMTINGSSTAPVGMHAHIYGPALAQPTAVRSVSVSKEPSDTALYIYDTATTHSLSSTYDGFTYYVSAGNMSGAIQVFGLSQ